MQPWVVLFNRPHLNALMVILNFGLGISGKIKETPDKQSTPPNIIVVVWLRQESPIPDDFADEIIRLAE